MKKVLIAHQSTIPHYRVPFYNALERLRPQGWHFNVVFDPSELTAHRFFKEDLDVDDFQFPILETRTWMIKVSDKRFCYQSFWSKAAKYDLIIVEDAINNLTYPFCILHQLGGAKVAYWGHGKDREIENIKGYKFFTERLKIFLDRQSDGFFAYTEGVKKYLEEQHVSANKIFTLNNTIDIEQQHDVFEKWYPQRTIIRQEMGVSNKKVLLFVGRFTANKRIDFLLDSFSILQKLETGFHLLLVGDDRVVGVNGLSNVSVLGTIVDIDKLGRIYTASDVFVFPGAVGLAPLQALCYDLPVVTIESNLHKPEYEYLSTQNSIILEAASTPEAFAQAIIKLFDVPGRLEALRQNIWPSIDHLTIERMAQNFINGVNTILDV